MSKRFSLSIPKPCSVQWASLSPVSNGGFCNSCHKTVVNFTQMTDSEIVEFISNKPSHICGRFRTNQLRNYTYTPALGISPGFTLLKAGITSLLLILSSKPLPAHTTWPKPSPFTQLAHDNKNADNSIVASSHTVRGVVQDEYDNGGIPGVNIVLKGTTIGTTTDLLGRFEFPAKLEAGDVLLFSFIGYETKEYVVPKNVTDTIEITLSLDVCVTMGELAIDGAYEEKKSRFQKMLSKIKAIF
jgi:hypothetical protein